MSIMLLVAMSMFAVVVISFVWNLVQVASSTDQELVPVVEVISYEHTHYCRTCHMVHGENCPNENWV